MKKEVLLSLLMTTPVAFPALAATEFIDLSGTDALKNDATSASRWKPNGGGVADAATPIEGTTGMACMAGINYIERTLTLPMGAYTLEFEGTDNCKVTVNGKDTYTINVDGTISSGFRVDTEKGDVVIRVSRVKAAEWGFSAMDLRLAFDFAPTRNALSKVDLSDIDALNKNITDATLKAESDKLQARKTKIQEALDFMAGTEPDPDDLFKAYDEWQLFKTPSKLNSDADALNNDIAAHNAKVKAANDAYLNQQANIANRLNYRKDVSNLTLSVDGDGKTELGLAQELKAKLDAAKDATEKAQYQKYYDEAVKLSSDIKAFGVTVEETYANLDVNAEATVKKLDKILNSLIEKYTELMAANGTITDDIKAYNDFKKGTGSKNQNYQNYVELQNLYLTYQTAMAQHERLEGYETAFADAISMKYGRELTEIFDNTRKLVDVDLSKQTISLHYITGAAKEIEKVKQAFQLAISQDATQVGSLAKVAADFEAFVKDQNDAKKDADKVTKDLQTLLDASKKNSVPASFQNEFNAKLNAATNAINAIKNAVDAAYGNIDKPLSATTYNKLIVVEAGKNTTKAQQDVDSYLKNIEPVVKAATDFATLKSEVARVDIDGMLANIVKKDYDELETAIGKLTPSNYNKNIAAINAKIDDVKNLVLGTNGLVDAFDKANCSKEIEALDKFINDRKIVDGAIDLVNGKEVAFSKTTYTDKKFVTVKVDGKDKKISFADRAKTFADQVAAAVKDNEGSANETLKAIQTIGNGADVDQLRTEIAKLRAEFNDNSANANYRTAQKAFDTAKVALQQVFDKSFPSYKEGGLDVEKATEPAKTALSKIAVALSNALAQTSVSKKESESAKIYTQVNSFIGKEIKDLNAAYKDAIDNVNAYNALVKAAEAIGDEAIAGVRAFNDKTSFKYGMDKTAWAFYDAKIGKTDNKAGFEKTAADIIADINKAVAATKVADNAYSKKAALEARINALAADMDALVKAITANEAAHNELLGESEIVRQLLDELDEKLDANGGYNPWETETKEVSELLLKANQDITASYNKGESAAAKVAQLAALEEVKLKANSIIEKFNSDYTNEIRKQNEALFQAGWSGDKGAYGILYTTYTGAVDAATNYELLKNRAYKNFVNKDTHTYVDDKTGETKTITGFGNIAELTKYIDLLNEINLKANKYKNELTKDDKNPVLLSESHPEYAKCLAAAATYKTAIENIAGRMKDFVDESAHKFYSDQKLGQPRALVAKDFNANLLSANGIVTITDEKEQLKDGKNTKVKYEYKGADVAIKATNDAYKAAADAYLKAKNIGLDMDGIANNLDKVQKFTAAQINEIGATQWAKNVEFVDARIDAWTADMATFLQDQNRNDVKNGNNVIPGNLTRFNDAVKAIADFKAKVAKNISEGEKYITLNDDETSTNQLGGWMTQLNQKYDALYTIYKAARDNHQANKAAADQYKAYMTGLVAADGCQTLFDELKAFTNSLAASNDTYADAKKDLDKIVEAIKDNQADYTTAKVTIDRMIADFKASLSNYYSNVAAAELSALRSQHTIVNSALNEAYVSGIEGFESYQKEVNDLNAQLFGSAEGLATAIAKAQAADTAQGIIDGVKALGPDMRAMEAKLASLEVTLKKNNPLPGVINTLNEKYDAVKAIVDKANGIVNSFDDVVKKNFAAFTASDYAAKLDAVKTSYSTAGNIALMQQENYVLAMTEIEDAVSAALVDIEATKALVDKSQAVFDTLKGQYDKFLKNRNDLSDLVAGYQYYVYGANNKYDEKELATLYPNEETRANLTALQKYNTQEQVKKYEANFAKVDALLADALKFITDKNANADVTKRLTDSDNLNKWLWGYKEGENTVVGLEKLLGEEIELNVTREEGAGAGVVWDYEGDELIKAIKNPFMLDEVKAGLIAKAKEVGAAHDSIKKLPATPTAKDYKAYAAALTKVIEDLRAITAQAVENTFKPGDLNGDGNTNVFDVSEYAGLLANSVSYEDLLAESAVKAKAADLNYDKKLTVGDLVLLSRLANNDLDESVFLPKTEATGVITTSLVSREAGISRYAVNVRNTSALVAGQIDLVLSEGMTVIDIQGAERTGAHNIITADDNKRVVISNMDSQAIEGNDGAVIYVEVFGDGKFDVDNAIFAERTSAEVRLAKPDGTSGIEDTVIDNNGGLKQRIYNAAGQALRGLQRGVNIIRNADGTVTKEYHK